MTNKLLIDEEPLQVLPGLAVAIGLNDALFLQQLHYWLRRSDHEHDGKRWVYNTYEEWKDQFPFWSLDTMQRIAKRLVDRGLVEIHQFTKMDWDRKNWYAINYDKLETLCAGIESRKLRSSRTAKRGLLESRKLRSSSTENTQEINKQEIPAFRVFECWKETMKRPKAKLDLNRTKAINARLADGYSVDDLCVAVHGCAESEFHMGANDRNTTYNQIELICRDAQHVDRFIAIAQDDRADRRVLTIKERLEAQSA